MSRHEVVLAVTKMASREGAAKAAKMGSADGRVQVQVQVQVQDEVGDDSGRRKRLRRWPVLSRGMCVQRAIAFMWLFSVRVTS